LAVGVWIHDDATAAETDRIIVDFEVKTLLDDGRAAADGVEGEIRARGAAQCVGYVDATRASKTFSSCIPRCAMWQWYPCRMPVWGVLAFANATIHMSAPEWSWLSGMSADTAKNVGIAHLDVLVKTIKPKVVTFKPDSELIPGLVNAVEIKGHTPGHSGYLIGSDGNTLLYIGDALHSFVVSAREPQWQNAFDADPATAAAGRVALLARVAASKHACMPTFPFPWRWQNREAGQWL
jgi:hypothetical protein